MPYQPSGWHGGIDTGSGQILAEGAREIGKGISAFSDALAAGIGNREKAKALDASMELISQQAPSLISPDFLNKFHGAGVSAKAGMMTTALAMLNRQDQQGAQGQSFGLQRSADRRAWAQARYNMDPKNKLPQSYTTPGGGKAIVTANGAVEPESNFLPQVGEWKPMPGRPGYLGHWTPEKGFTGAAVPAAAAKSGLPNITFVEDPTTGMGAYLDANQDVVDPDKLVRVKTTSPEVPAWNMDVGTGKPFAMTPAVPAKKQVEIAATGKSDNRGTRTYIDPETKRRIREWPDGRTEYLSFPDDGNTAAGQKPEWIPISPAGPEPSGSLFPTPGQTAAPAPAAAAPKAAVPFWKR